MKFSLFIMAVTFSFSSFAMSTEKLIKACENAGIEKVLAQAKSYGLKVKKQDIKECGVDNRSLSSSKYVWFCATTAGGERKIQVLTQKSFFSECI